MRANIEESCCPNLNHGRRQSHRARPTYKTSIGSLAQILGVVDALGPPIPIKTNGTYAAIMELVRLEQDYSVTRLRAVQDAIEMQDLTVRQAWNAGVDAPPYKLTELIGKGSFGRVYKATTTRTSKTVAVKIVNIEEGDVMAPYQSDTFAEILKEVTTLRILNDGGAKNVNRIIDSILVGHSMWMITEYCAGGSVATLMQPAGRLPEPWIIPILREVAEAIFWVHKQGIIHRDLKCANVLVTEEGGVQLCDFGVAGIIESKFEKRSTITGTLQWMAPELFDSNVTYGKEVDIWAFGSMAYEAATGFPPNATTLLDMDLTRFGAYLRESCPRLEGDEYSEDLKNLITFCMVPNPAKRPRIEDVQVHRYILDSADKFPSASLKELVRSFKYWERKGGNRHSLFMPGGAQCDAHPRNCSVSTENEGWDYGTMDEADQLVFAHNPHKVPKSPVRARPALTRGQPHRSRLPADVRAADLPLAKAFDPNTVSDYQDLVNVAYRRPSTAAAETQSAVPTSYAQPNIPGTQDTSSGMTIRESPIRVGAAIGETDLTSIPATPSSSEDLNTIKPKSQSIPSNTGDDQQLQLFGTSRTQDWTFPHMAPSSSTAAAPANPQHELHHHRRTSSAFSGSIACLRSRSSSASSAFTINLGATTAGVAGMDVAISPISHIDDPFLSRRRYRSDGFTISSRISLIDLDASLVSPSTPEKTITSSTVTNKNNNSNKDFTESFPAFSLPPLESSSKDKTSRIHSTYLDDNDYSASLINPDTGQSQGRFQPSPLLPSLPNENGPNPPQTTYVHHHRRSRSRSRSRKDSGYYASSSSCSSASVSRSGSVSYPVPILGDSMSGCSSISGGYPYSGYRERTTTNSSSWGGSQSILTSPSSCFGTPLQGPHSCSGRCQCPTIDETLALDETPARPRSHFSSGAGRQQQQHIAQPQPQRPGLRREPSLYLPCSSDLDEHDEKQLGVSTATDDGGSGYTEKTDCANCGLFQPRIILGSRTTSDESVEGHHPYTSNSRPNSNITLGSSTRSGQEHYTRVTSPYGNLNEAGIENRRQPSESTSSRRLIQGSPKPPLPAAPRPEVVLGMVSREALRDELARLLGSLSGHLTHAGDVIMALPAVRVPAVPVPATSQIPQILVATQGQGQKQEKGQKGATGSGSGRSEHT